ncbi:MAG: TetR/AcrR family transcriptional regulator [Solirubrobacterales bacterium]
MRKQGGSESGRSVLEPTLPVDLSTQEQRRKIVEAMIASVAEKTYAGTTISDIVSRASVSRTTFYKRFGDKQSCFDAALQQCVETLRTTAKAAIGPEDPPPLAVHKAIAASLQLLANEPGLAHLVIGEAVNVEPTGFGRYRNDLVPQIQALWEANGERPKIHSDPQLALGRAQVLIFNKISAGATAELPQLLPELVYLILLPFGGHDVAVEQSRLAQAREVEVPGSVATA